MMPKAVRAACAVFPRCVGSPVDCEIAVVSLHLAFSSPVTYSSTCRRDWPRPSWKALRQWHAVDFPAPPPQKLRVDDNDNDHSSSQLSVREALTCSEGHGAWALAQKNCLCVPGIVPLGMKLACSCCGVMCFTHVEVFRGSTVCCLFWFAACFCFGRQEDQFSINW